MKDWSREIYEAESREHADDDLRAEFAPRKRRNLDCSDGFCGAADCRKCGGWPEEGEDE